MTVPVVPWLGDKSDKKLQVPDDGMTRLQMDEYERVPTNEEMLQARVYWLRLALFILFFLFVMVTTSFFNVVLVTKREHIRNVAAQVNQTAAMMTTGAEGLPAPTRSNDTTLKRYNELMAKLLNSSVVVTKSARFVHDFNVNVTGIVDIDGRRCFIMPLVADAVVPPSSLFDLLFKMSRHYYSLDVHKVIEGMRVVKQPILDLSPYGQYLAKDCACYATFILERAINAPTSTLASAAATVATE